MPVAINLRVPAKLNTFLHITGRRSDGYHTLQTVFRAINLYDELALTLLSSSEITRRIGPSDVSAEADLCVRAAQLVKAHTQYPGGVDIALYKKIPLGAGMGGGSSDAAGVLLGLNQLWQLKLSAIELAALALKLGADVPFFLKGGDQWAQGIGELLMPIALAPSHYVIVHTGQHCATAELFSAPTLKRDCLPISIEQVQAGIATCNVFEPLVLARYPEIASAHQWLIAQAGNARLTGSGGALFATVPDHTAAMRIKSACPAPWQAWFARSLGNPTISA